MKIGLAMTARQLPGSPRALPEIYRQVLDEAVLGEELGFDSWRLAEHHFAEDQHNPAALPLLAAAAVRTERIRLGTYVLLLALHNPLRIAEDAAMVDILSGGRLDLAIGAGPMPGECAVFGVPAEERYGRTYEAAEVLEKCFTQEQFDHHGRYFDFPGVRVTTKPVQPGGPPIYMAALGPQSLARAGTRGYHLASVLHTPLVHIYADAQEHAGRTRADYRLMSGPVTVHLAATREQAWDECERALHWWISFYRARGLEMPLPAVEEMRSTPGVGIFGQPFAVGTPEDALAVLEAYKDVDLDEMVIQFNHPGMAPEPVSNSMRLFASELMDEVRSWGAGA
ncbi:MAG TPA: LLM class flavin-dependent oxidoreductase [Solirubrobacteraceae bacterium]|jgi:alkanesulfonate monooxygenase SsuD/methylene tetrahydromethanopterin reductase-like flavin-dependent oxidoreductase (luciferase family)|nr:LLM class flavin-dependent oxidoreductase [Solirubrobacteraceae bacterium]